MSDNQQQLADAWDAFTAYRAGIEDRVVADLHDGELMIADDGTFELMVGGPDTGGNWLRIRPN